MSHSRKAPQFGRVPYWIVESEVIAAMKPADARVYLALCAHAGNDWTARPGVRRLAAKTGLMIGTVSEALHRLTQLGVVSIAWSGNGCPASYRIVSVQPAPNGQGKPTVLRPPNGPQANRSAPASPTVQRPQENRSAGAERNILNTKETPSENQEGVTPRENPQTRKRVPPAARPIHQQLRELEAASAAGGSR
ncbi:MAG: helix-turn-helix domain-containing protein [Planctomycetes bacterium]|nr:helix-turn-helix domain-containing protein [Planctomycetota bacterium]